MKSYTGTMVSVHAVRMKETGTDESAQALRQKNFKKKTLPEVGTKPIPLDFTA